MFDKLPNELLQHILSYIDLRELKNISIVSKYFRENTKVVFNKYRVTQYYIKCIEDFDIIEKSKSEKIKVDMRWLFTSFLLYNYCPYSNRLRRRVRGPQDSNLSTYIYKLRYVHTLDLSYTTVSDVSMLGKVHTLNLSNCYKVTDVSALGNVHTLDLSGTKVSDVSALKNVRELNLFGCYNVTNVSTLGNVRKLILRDTNVINVSMLGNVQTLNLSHTKVRDVSMLGNVHTLVLNNTNVFDVSTLGNVHELWLDNTNVTDVSMLINVYELHLYGTKVGDTSMLINTKKIYR